MSLWFFTRRKRSLYSVSVPWVFLMALFGLLLALILPLLARFR